MNTELRRSLESAYRPCKNFAADCHGLIKPWKPASGHVPRGFYGALGELSEIRLVMVLAEPADPASNEDYSSKGREMELAFAYAEKCYLYCGADGHDNVRKIVHSCFPSLKLLDAMRKVWITESVLCSALTSGGNIRVACVDRCGSDYLGPQLQLLLKANPNAIVAAMGSKAIARLNRLKRAPEFAHLNVEKCEAVFGLRKRRGYYSPTWEQLAHKVRNSA